MTGATGLGATGNGGDIVAARHRRIIAIARQIGSVSVDALAETLGVTPQTIRKDLNHLARAEMLSRVHGGAVVTSGVDNLDHEARREVASAAKEAIGAAAAALIPDGASLFVTIGTTTEAFARHLLRHRNLVVITNNLNVADILAASPAIEVFVAGGRLRPGDRAVTGPLAMEFMRGFRPDFAVLSASALDDDGTMLDFDSDEVRVLQVAMAAARKAILAIDRSKFGRPAPVRIGDLGDIDYLVTDRIGGTALADRCRAAEVAVVEAEG